MLDVPWLNHSSWAGAGQKADSMKVTHGDLPTMGCLCVSWLPRTFQFLLSKVWLVEALMS
jgi:hypothetical protein